MTPAAKPAPSTSSYAVLGLLALQPWTAYELAQQMQRSMRWAWPRSERHAYDEPKRLVRMGWATARDNHGGQRVRTEYRITPAGRRALAEWLGTPPALPMLEVEVLLRVIHADQGTTQDLLQALAASRQRLHEEALPLLVGQAQDYLETGGPFPERLHVICLFVDFYLRFIDLLESWTADAIAEVERWPAVEQVGLTPFGRDVLQRVLDTYGSVLDGERA